MAPLSGAASELLASAILKLDHFGSTKGWQMTFVIEGVITIALALVTLVVMTDRPETVSTPDSDVSTSLTSLSRRVG
jgi:sugar phosphate permease